MDKQKAILNWEIVNRDKIIEDQKEELDDMERRHHRLKVFGGAYLLFLSIMVLASVFI